MGHNAPQLDFKIFLTKLGAEFDFALSCAFVLQHLYLIKDCFVGQKLWKAVQIFLGIANAAVISVWICSKGGFFISIPQPAVGSTGVDYKDFVPILLTAIGVMIAIFTLFLAIAAIWGYTQIKDETAKVAKETAEKVAAEEAKKICEKLIPQEVAEYMLKLQVLSVSQADKYGLTAGDQNGKS
jgi:hypothetical protein